GVRRTDENAEYKELTDRITEIERQLYTVGPQYLESLDQQLAMTVRTETAIEDTLHAMPGAAMQYGRLLRERTLREAVYLALQKQLKQAELRDVLRQDRIKIVDVPRVANLEDPAFPKKPVMLALGAVLGLALALTVALLMELWGEPELEPERSPVR
ncbi:MAG TPA: GNVR domain-containing protein, partial [Gemmatimonadaceae bacterium]